MERLQTQLTLLDGLLLGFGPLDLPARGQTLIAKDAQREIKRALKEADDPGTAWVSQDEAKARSAQRREDWKDAASKATGG